jgi:hypothetical protein
MKHRLLLHCSRCCRACIEGCGTLFECEGVCVVRLVVGDAVFKVGALKCMMPYSVIIVLGLLAGSWLHLSAAGLGYTCGYCSHE